MGKLIVRILSLLLIAAFLPTAVLAAEWNLEDGSIEITATANAEGGTTQTVSQGEKSAEDSNPTITSNGNQTGNTITIKSEAGATANVTLEDVNIDASGTGNAAVKVEGEGDINLNIEGKNAVSSGRDHAGVEKSNGGNLTIGSGSGSGELKADGGYRGAGIGGGNKSSAGNITITGGEIIANGGNGGAGIGGGSGGNGSDITISGGKVTASSGSGGASIGGGAWGNGSDVTISGDAQIAVVRGTDSSIYDAGAGIGNGADVDDGEEIPPDTSGLYTTGKVEYFDRDGNVLETITGTVEPPVEPEKSAAEEPAAREPLYRVTDLESKNLPYQAETADGVLTLTANADGAILTGTLRALGYLANQGIEKIIFTDGTHTAELVLADLIAKGEAEDIYVLTLGAANTLTLNGEAVDF